MARSINTIAAQLPVRSDYDAALPTPSARIDINRVQNGSRASDLLDAVRVFEAGDSHLPVPTDIFRSLFARSRTPNDIWTATVWSRLAAMCHPHLSPAEATEILGSVGDRVRLVCSADRSILDAVIDEGTASVSVTRLLPLDSDEVSKPVMPWDIPPTGKRDALNDATVACLERIKDACPELQRFTISTVTASGEPYRLRDFEPGHKDMVRPRFPERSAVGRAVGYQAALRRATSSETWTEVFTTQISAAADLARAATNYLSGSSPTTTRVVVLSGAPSSARCAISSAPCERLRSLQTPVRAQRRLLTTSRTVPKTKLRVCCVPPWTLSDNACPEESHKAETPPSRSDRAPGGCGQHRPGASRHPDISAGPRGGYPDELTDAMRHSADLAAALHRQPGLARLVRAADPLVSAREDVGDKSKTRRRSSPQECWGRCSNRPRSRLGLVEDPHPASWALDSKTWVVFAPAHVLDETLALLATLDDVARERLGPHLVVLCVTDLVSPVAAMLNPCRHLVRIGVSPLASDTSSAPALSAARCSYLPTL